MRRTTNNGIHLMWVFSSVLLVLAMRGASAFSSNASPMVECVDCAIVGGGPAGLATAIALTKASPSSSIAIFEKDVFQPKGASIQISKAGWKSLQELDDDNDNGLVSALENTGVPVTGVELKSWKYHPENTTLGKRQIAKKWLSNIQKAATSFLFRKVLNRVHLWHDVRMVLADHAVRLYEQNSPSKTPLLNSNCALVAILPPDHENDQRCFELTFQNLQTGEERTIHTQYLFACDGTKSTVRSILPNEPDVLLSEKKSVWRGMAPHFNARGTATFFRGTADSDTAGRSALIFPGGKEAGSSWTVISDIQDGKSSSMGEAKERVLSVINTMGATIPNGEPNPDYMRLKQIIEDSTVIIENKLHVRDFEDQPWEASYDGLIYLGDAAHPVRPTGEGTALAFEDASVLRQILATSGLSVESLRAFEDARFLPVKTISEKIRAGAESYYQKESSNEPKDATKVVVGSIEN